MMKVCHFFETATSTLSYLVYDTDSAVGVVIDPVRDFDPSNARTSWNSAEEIASVIAREGISLAYVIDTHAHADHMSGLPYFRERYRAKTVTGSRVAQIQSTFREFYNLGAGLQCDGSQFDVLLDEGDTLEVGSLRLSALHTPGHTPAHMSWQIDDAIFLGDTLFAPDYGSARCDFPGGSAAELYDSIQRLYALADDTRLFLCHDYAPNPRPLRYVTTVAEHKRGNVQINQETSRDEFIEFRNSRDAELAAPKLILQSVQVNIRGGQLPPAESNATAYLNIPLNKLGRNQPG